MREIKFECIYRPTGEKFIPQKIDFNNNMVFGDFDNTKNNYCYFSLEHNGKGDAWLRQYTGLKDRNGKEIYERDIIQYEIEAWKGYVKKVAVEVYFGKGMFRTHRSILMMVNQTSEVIGNIYENHELVSEDV